MKRTEVKEGACYQTRGERFVRVVTVPDSGRMVIVEHLGRLRYPAGYSLSWWGVGIRTPVPMSCTEITGRAFNTPEELEQSAVKQWQRMLRLAP